MSHIFGPYNRTFLISEAKLLNTERFCFASVVVVIAIRHCLDQLPIFVLEAKPSRNLKGKIGLMFIVCHLMRFFQWHSQWALAPEQTEAALWQSQWTKTIPSVQRQCLAFTFSSSQSSERTEYIEERNRKMEQKTLCCLITLVSFVTHH